MWLLLFILTTATPCSDLPKNTFVSVDQAFACLETIRVSKDDVEEVVAADSFCVFAAMNPGGDFGKRELSPALRNRFTEIWVTPFDAETDLLAIVAQRLDEKRYAPAVNRFLLFARDAFDVTSPSGTASPSHAL